MFSMETPILFIIFNRPDTTARVFEEIRKAKPKQLFVAADGARNEGEWGLCNKTRDIIKGIDWDCEVKTLFRDKNLGCKISCASAITWFFENVEQGIILEDDCLPNPSFFAFCEIMLDKYKDDNRVGMISGDNFVQEATLKTINPNRDKYYFVRPTYIWGWATWRRAWDKYDIEMKSWPEIKKSGYLNDVFKNKNVSIFFEHILQYVYRGGATTWDTQWFFSCLVSNMLCIIPPRNLISNIGTSGTHSNSSKESPLMNMKTEFVSIENLKHPEDTTRNIDVENIILSSTLADRFSYRIILVEILEFLWLDDLTRMLYRKLKLKL